MNWEKRKQSEEWTKAKADEFVRLESDLTFSEWCYQQGRADGAREFAEWLAENKKVINPSKGYMRSAEILAEYEKEQMK